MMGWLIAESDQVDVICYRAARERRDALISQYCYRKSCRPSVHPSVTLMYRGHIGWTSSNVRVFAPRSHNIGIRQPSPRGIPGTPKIRVE